jgi:aconitate hydratase
LQLLAPFLPWDGKNILGASIDQSIWEMYHRSHFNGRSVVAPVHLDNISNNMLIGAINAFNQKQILLKST